MNKNLNTGISAPSSAFYVYLATEMEGMPRQNGFISQPFPLEGPVLAERAKWTGGIQDSSILELLGDGEGIRKLVQSIGIAVHAESAGLSEMEATIENRAAAGEHSDNRRLSFACRTDGTETRLETSLFPWMKEGSLGLGQLSFALPHAGAAGTVTVIFYLNEGFHAPALVSDHPVDFQSSAYREMISRSLLSSGNNKRLKSAIQKAQNGEPVTIAYIGGSITQGACARPAHDSCYAYLSYLKFKEMYGKGGGDSISFIKAGVGGTPSELGMIRYDRDVLRDGAVQPDIVIVEFAVNDADDETKGKCYESLVLKALSGEKSPAVILLFSVFINDWNLQDRLAPVGTYYGLPMASIKDAVTPQFSLSRAEGGVITKRQFFDDIYHPGNAGHVIMADCLAYLFAKAGEAECDSEDIMTAKPPLIGNEFVNVTLLDRSNAAEMVRFSEGGFQDVDRELQAAEFDDNLHAEPLFPHNWMHRADSRNAPFIMTLRCKRLLLIYKDSGSSEFGTAEISVDGKLVKKADPQLIKWTHCHASILINETVSDLHTVEIAMADGHTDKCFTILGFGVVD
ncbi:SGNH/GDSL hydrolase family protein [Paenibacillus sp. CAU 1782]